MQIWLEVWIDLVCSDWDLSEYKNLLGHKVPEAKVTWWKSANDSLGLSSSSLSSSTLRTSMIWLCRHVLPHPTTSIQIPYVPTVLSTQGLLKAGFPLSPIPSISNTILGPMSSSKPIHPSALNFSDSLLVSLLEVERTSPHMWCALLHTWVLSSHLQWCMNISHWHFCFVHWTRRSLRTELYSIGGFIFTAPSKS